MGEERSAPRPRIVDVARIDVIGDHVQPHPGVEIAAQRLPVELGDVAFLAALGELEKYILRESARVRDRAVERRELVVGDGERRRRLDRAVARANRNRIATARVEQLLERCEFRRVPLDDRLDGSGGLIHRVPGFGTLDVALDPPGGVEIGSFSFVFAA